MKSATLNLTSRWCSPRSIIKSHVEKSGRGPGLGEFPKSLRFSVNISATAEASDFKFGVQLRFSKTIIKLHKKEKVGVAMG